jgi:hypothetical protein
MVHLSVKKLAAITLLLLSAACKPIPFYWTVPDGPPEYVRGYNDGCDSGIGAAGGIWYKYWYGFRRDPVMLDNPLYKQGWNEGFSYCRSSFSTTQTFF